MRNEHHIEDSKDALNRVAAGSDTRYLIALTDRVVRNGDPDMAEATMSRVAGASPAVNTSLREEIGPDVGVAGNQRDRWLFEMLGTQTKDGSFVRVSSRDALMPGSEVVYEFSTIGKPSAQVHYQGTSEGMDPAQAALKIRMTIEGILDRNEPLRAALQDQGFELCKGLTDLLPVGMRGIGDLRDPPLTPRGPAQSPKR